MRQNPLDDKCYGEVLYPIPASLCYCPNAVLRRAPCLDLLADIRSDASLQGLRQLCTDNGALLCFDEVMTGFRIAKGCAQEHFGILPDLTTVCS